MSGESEDLGATNVRLTFRTFKAFVKKLRGIAQAHELKIGRRLSVGAALNLVILAYDDAYEQAKNRKKGRKR